jgi:hypothetical protein
MLAMFVTAAVLSKGTLLSEEQLPNISDIFATDAVLNKGMLSRDAQP